MLLLSQKLTEEETQKARDFIEKERKNYPNTPLEPLFREWEQLVDGATKKRDEQKQEITAHTQTRMTEARTEMESA